MTLQEELEAEAKNILLLPHPCFKLCSSCWWGRQMQVTLSTLLLTTLIVEGISSDGLYIVKPKATCHITRQAIARASVRYPI